MTDTIPRPNTSTYPSEPPSGLGALRDVSVPPVIREYGENAHGLIPVTPRETVPYIMFFNRLCPCITLVEEYAPDRNPEEGFQVTRTGARHSHSRTPR